MPGLAAMIAATVVLLLRAIEEMVSPGATVTDFGAADGVAGSGFGAGVVGTGVGSGFTATTLWFLPGILRICPARTNVGSLMPLASAIFCQVVSYLAPMAVSVSPGCTSWSTDSRGATGFG